MRMTREHFEKIAEVIRNTNKEWLDQTKRYGISTENPFNRLCDRFAQELKNTNPFFDKEKFLNACKIETD